MTAKPIMPEAVLEARRAYCSAKAAYGLCYTLTCARLALPDQSRCAKCQENNRISQRRLNARRREP